MKQMQNVHDAMARLELAYQLCSQIDYLHGLANVYQLLGDLYALNAELPKAHNHYTEAFKRYQLLQDQASAVSGFPPSLHVAAGLCGLC